jgi:hypothetical protein
MTDNKNMLKTKNNRAEVKSVPKKKFYGVVEYKYTKKDEKGKDVSVTKTAVLKLDEKMTRLHAKKEINAMAKSFGGKVTYFGAVKNS